MRHSALPLTLAIATATTVALASPSAVVAHPRAAPSVSTPSAAPALRKSPETRSGRREIIPGRYVVVLRPGHGARLPRVAARAGTDGATVTQRFTHTIHGFAAHMSAAAARSLSHDPAVAYVEPDQRFHATGTQSDPIWNLDRIDQRSRTGNHRYAYDTTGAGVTAYVIDSGIRRTHHQIAGRVGSGFTAVKDGRGTRDCFGHGTHVAGTIGGKTFGVAKGVRLVPVRVLGCKGGGTLSGIISGVDWVTAQHQGTKPAVANMSLGGGSSRALDNAVRRSVFDGVTYVVAAGNDSDSACAYSPADTGSAITVGATNARDARASFSNRGGCVDLFAPGVGVKSAGITSDSATAVHDGTSMATPHVAGVAALYLQAHPAATPAEVSDAIDDATTKGVLTSLGSGSPDRLLYSLVDRVAPDPVLPPADNTLANPGFESGLTGWTATAEVVTDDNRARARTGSWVAWLNGWGEAHTDRLVQTVDVPATASPRLSFWRKIWTGEPTDAAYDFLTVSIEVEGTGERSDLVELSNLDASSSWKQVSLDLTPYAGQRVTLRFTGVEDEQVPTSFLLDDVYVTGQ